MNSPPRPALALLHALLRGRAVRAVIAVVTMSLLTVIAAEAPASAGVFSAAPRAASTTTAVPGQPGASIAMSSSGDLTISYEVDNVDPGVVNSQLVTFLGTANPGPTTVSDRIAQGLTAWDAKQPVGTLEHVDGSWPGCACTLTLNSTGSGATASNTLVLDVPAAALGNQGVIPLDAPFSKDSFWAQFIAGGIATVAAIGAGAVCAFAIGATGPIGAAVCGALAGAVQPLVWSMVAAAFTGVDFFGDPQVWGNALISAFWGAVAGGAGGFAIGWAGISLKGLLTEVGVKLQAALDPWKARGGVWLGKALGGMYYLISKISGGSGAAMATYISGPDCGQFCGLKPALNPNYLRVLPLGDSITFGIQSSDGGGYRCPLSDGQSAMGIGNTYVGSQTNGPCAQNANEGHPGWTIEGLQSLEQCTVAGYQPNVVLLDAGTNDINVATPWVNVAGGDPTHAANAMAQLITSVHNDDPSAAIVVGALIPTTNATTSANMNIFNQQVSSWIHGRQQLGWHVSWADMGAVQLADLADGLHPNDSGYRKMATAWNIGIDQAILDGWVQPANAPGKGCASPAPTGPPAPKWQAQGVVAPGVQGYAPPIWNPQGQVAPGVQSSGWSDAPGQQIRFAPLFGSGRSDYLFLRPDSSVLGWRNDGPAPGGGITWTSVGLVVPGIQAAGYKGPGDGTLSFVDLTGQGRADYVWTKTDGTTLTWLNSSTSASGQPVWVGPFTIVPGSTVAAAGYTGPSSGTLRFADLSGDGWPDLVWVKPDGTIHWWESGHDGLVNHTWTDRGDLAGVGAPGGELQFAKASGAARADLLDIRPDSSVVGYGLRANGSGGLSWASEGLIAPGVQGAGYTGPGDGDIDFADLTGHGRADYVWVRPDSSALMWQNTAGAGLDDQIRFAPLDTGNTKRADYLDISPLDGSITAWLNAGQAGSGGAYTWVPGGTVFPGVPGYQGQGNGSIGNIQLAHVTSPGQAGQDALYVRPDGSVQGWALLPGSSTSAVPLGTVVPALKNGYDGTGEIQFADMDGKGTADYLWVHPDSSVSMWQNQYPNWTPKGEIAVGVQASGWTDSPGQHIRFADLTGSGRADYIFIRPDSSVLAWYNPGPSANYAWQSMGQIAPGVQASGWTTGTPGNTIQFADLNGDGRADYLWVRPDSSVLMWQNTPG